jgi:hypothetical protein
MGTVAVARFATTAAGVPVDNHVDIAPDQLGCEAGQPFGAPIPGPRLKNNALAVDVATLPKFLLEKREKG